MWSFVFSLKQFRERKKGKVLLPFALLFKGYVNTSLPHSPRLVGRYKVVALMVYTFYLLGFFPSKSITIDM